MKTRCKKTGTDGKQIRLLEGETIYVGLDVHKKQYHLAVWSATRQCILTTKVRPASPKSLARYLAPHREAIRLIVYEAGPTGYTLARHLVREGFPLEVISASHTPTSRRQEQKTDRLDCRRLAEYAAKGLLRPVDVPSPEEEGARQVIRFREQMKQNLQRVKVRIRSLLLQHGLPEPSGLAHWSNKAVAALRTLKCSHRLRFVLDEHLRDLEYAGRQLARATKAIEDVCKERYQEEVDLLKTIPGVGPLTAMVIATEMPRPERFSTAAQVTSFLGLAPLVRASGETRHELGRHRGGNKRLRTYLVEATWQWIRREPGAREIYNRLVANTGSPKKATVGMARRLGILAWKMRVTRTPYSSDRVA